MGADHAARSAGVLPPLRGEIPERVRLDVGHRHLPRQIHGGGAGAETNADGRAVHGRHELARQTRRHAEVQHLALGSNRLMAQWLPAMTRSTTPPMASSTEVKGALAAIFSNTRRSPAAIASRALALRDVGDARAYQPPIGARQAHEAHFAGHGLPERIAVHPLEHRCIARQRAVDVAARQTERGSAVGLPRGADLVRSAREQGLAGHLEEAACVVVDVDESCPDRRRTPRSPRARAPPRSGSGPRFRAWIAPRDAAP